MKMKLYYGHPHAAGTPDNTIRKLITRTCTCRAHVSMNRRRGQSLGGQTECVNVYELGYEVIF